MIQNSFLSSIIESIIELSEYLVFDYEFEFDYGTVS